MSVAYDDTGGRAEWTVPAGDPISKTWTITEGATPVDVSGATLTGVIRATADPDSTLVATFTMSKPAVADDNAVKALVAAGIAAPGAYYWAVKVELADGETVLRGQGPFIVTRPTV